MRKTKIVATLGPACNDKSVLKELIDAGANVCRLNFSHGTHEDHEEFLKTLDDLNHDEQTTTAVLGDLQGPKLRIGNIENGEIEIVEGQQLTFTTQERMGSADGVFINYDNFPRDVKAGETVLVDDGKLELKVASTNGKDEVQLEVIHGGALRSRKGVNLPNTHLSLPCLTEKDLEDLKFVLEKDFDWVGLSFVRSANDIRELRKIIDESGKHTKIIAKIEKPEAIDEIDEIIQLADGVMVARGDLGVEIPMERVPMIQKEIVSKCMHYSKPSIIATQMMESMIQSVTPTRAEVNDVANAVLDGADAVMLSGETSTGKFPVQAVKAMKTIVEEVETFEGIYHHEEPPKRNEERYISDSICFNSARLAERVDASAIITMTFSGYTAFRVSSHRPKADVVVFTGNKKILNQLNLLWGVTAFYYDKMESTDHTISDSIEILKQNGFVKKDDYVINIASMPIEQKGTTNMLKLSLVS